MKKFIHNAVAQRVNRSLRGTIIWRISSVPSTVQGRGLKVIKTRSARLQRAQTCRRACCIRRKQGSGIIRRKKVMTAPAEMHALYLCERKLTRKEQGGIGFISIMNLQTLWVWCYPRKTMRVRVTWRPLYIDLSVNNYLAINLLAHILYFWREMHIAYSFPLFIYSYSLLLFQLYFSPMHIDVNYS